MYKHFLKNNFHNICYVLLLFTIFLIPCHIYAYIEPYLLIYKIMCVVLIYYGTTLSTNTSLIITLIVLASLYKIHKLCGLQDIFS